MSESSGFEGLSGQEILDKIEVEGLGEIENPKYFILAKEKFALEKNPQKVKEMEWEFYLFGLELNHPFIYDDESQRFRPIEIANKIMDEAKEYFKIRCQETKNNVLKRRYCDFIWTYHKDYKFAEIAIDTYLDLLDYYFKREKYNDISDCLARSLQISLLLKNEKLIEKCIGCHLEYLNKYDEGKNHFWLGSILQSMLSYKHIEKFVTFDEVNKYFELAIEGAGYDVVNRIDFVKQKIEFYKMFGRHKLIEKAEEEMAESYMREADRREDSAFAQSINFDKAIKQYTKINKNRKYTEQIDSLKIRIKQVNKEAKSQMTTITGETQIPSSMIQGYIDHYKPLSINDCFGLITTYFPIMISRNEARDRAKDFIANAPVAYFATNILMTDNNISAEIEPGERKNEKLAKDEIKRHCFMIIRIFIIPLFDMFTKEKNMDSEQLMNFISASHLIEKERHPIIKVGINRFIAEDYISSIHILIFQIEGILRDVLGRLGRPTTTLKHDSTMELSLDAILNDDILKKQLDDDFCYFLRTMLSDPLGMNLRNRVGHALSVVGEFNRATNIMLIMVLLKFGILKYSSNPA